MRGSDKRKNKNPGLILRVFGFLIIIGVLFYVTNYIGVNPKNSSDKNSSDNINTSETQETESPTESKKHVIEGVNVISQDHYYAGCETYACTMMLQYLGYDIDEFAFADQYLIAQPIYYDEYGTRYGPDMNSAQAGDLYTGYGIFAPAMAKSINLYLDTTDSGKRAYALKNVSLDDLCEQYIVNDIPAMVWVTVGMEKSYDTVSWVVSYVDENSDMNIGDTFTWQNTEHCNLLIGYDEDAFYFADSVEGKITRYEKDICRDRFEEIGSMALVVR